MRAEHARGLLLGAALAAVALALSLLAATAGAVVVHVGGHAYGVTPVNGVSPQGFPGAVGSLSAAARPQGLDEVGLMNYHGGPVMHGVTTHVVYWDPGKEFTATTKGIVNKFFTDVAHDQELGSNVFGVTGQYTDGTGRAIYKSTFGSEGTDEAAYPSTGNCTIPSGDSGPPYTKCLFDSQIKAALSAYISAEKLPTGPTHQYFVLTPHKVVSCFNETPEEELAFGKICSNNFFCAYHSSISGGTPSEVIYSDIPFSLLDSGNAKGCQSDGNGTIQHPNGDITGTNETTRYADIALKFTSHEYIEASTDPLGNAWFDVKGQEIGDKCNGAGSGEGADPNAFVPVLGGKILEGNLFNQAINANHYYLQSEWDNAANACLMAPAPPTSVKFTASPESATLGTSAEFKGASTDKYGGPVYIWKWGDGTESTGATPSHTYGAAGSFEVTMTVTDQFTGATAKTTGTFVVAAPPPPVAVPAATVAPAPAAAAPTLVTPPVPNSELGATGATFNATTGVLTVSTTTADPGKLTWLATFQNGKFGVFAASSGKCKAGLVRLGGRCRLAKIIFARGSVTVASPGAVHFTLKPSSSALKALKAALKQRKGLPVTLTLTFQSARGGSPVSRTQSLVVKLKKK